MNLQTKQLSTGKTLTFVPHISTNAECPAVLLPPFQQSKASQLLAPLLWWPFHSLTYPAVRKLLRNFYLMFFFNQHLFVFCVQHHALCCLLWFTSCRLLCSLSPHAVHASVLIAQSEPVISNWSLFLLQFCCPSLNSFQLVSLSGNNMPRN